MNKRNLTIGIAAIALLIVLIKLFSSNEENAQLTAKVTKEKFEDIIVSSGELLAENSKEIMGPENLRKHGFRSVKIQDLVAEGTFVNEGDYVGTLDKAEINSKINDVLVEIEKFESQYTQVKLDTTLSLRQDREEIKNLEYNLETKKLTLEQSKYEPPAVISQLKMEVEKAKRDLTQNKENYKIKQKQAAAKMTEASANLKQKQIAFQKLKDLESEFIILAPSDGMVTYYKEWDGSKRKVGSTISPWAPQVATLPDLSKMLSKTYINEVDIRKIKEGQKVKIGLDAFPEKQLNGIVKEVANVGEKKADSDSKVFEVMIDIKESDSTFRPGLTSSNRIVTFQQEGVFTIPLEAIFSNGEVNFVYVKDGLGAKKYEVKLGRQNSESAILLEGLNEEQIVLLVEPAGMEEVEVQLLNEEK